MTHDKQSSSLPDPALASLLAAHAAAALYLMDEAGRVTWMNPAAETMFGWSQSEFAGRTLHDVVHHKRPSGEPFPMSECPLGQVMASGKAVLQHEDHFIHKDGRFVPVSCSNAPVLRDGRLVGAALVVHDLTEQRRAEAEAARTLKQLRASEENLEEAYAMAVAANRRKDEFLAMLGHELRNPLAPIVTALNLLRLRGAGFHHELSTIERQVQHLSTLVEDLLDVSRITRGGVNIEKKRLELAALMAEAVEMVSPLIERKRHTLSIDVPARRLYVDGDAHRLRQVLANLLGNAAKFTPTPGEIRFSARPEAGGVVVEVADNGVGISSELLPHVFDLFVQGQRSSDRSQGGLGLGLAIVKSLVELHDGRVSAFSAGPGQGSTFRVYLPAATSEPSQLSEAHAPDRQPSALVRQLPPARVLIVDDNVDAADLLVLLLTEMGLQARAAHDGPSALMMVREFHPDLAILDVGLPVMDGYELAQQLRRSEHLREKLRVIAVTGYGTDRDRERSQLERFDAHLTKPVEIDVLVATLRSVLAAG